MELFVISSGFTSSMVMEEVESREGAIVSWVEFLKCLPPRVVLELRGVIPFTEQDRGLP